MTALCIGVLRKAHQNLEGLLIGALQRAVLCTLERLAGKGNLTKSSMTDVIGSTFQWTTLSTNEDVLDPAAHMNYIQPPPHYPRSESRP